MLSMIRQVIVLMSHNLYETHQKMENRTRPCIIMVTHHFGVSSHRQFFLNDKNKFPYPI